MSDTMRTTISQFSSLEGRVQQRAVNTRAVEPAADVAGAERGNLYILAEVTGTGGGHTALYRQILNAVQTAYYELGDSVETALRQAIRNAHFVMTKANEALPEANWRAGITCAALHGQTLTIAQAGPALAVISHPKTVDQFPAEASWAGVPLGGKERPEPELFRTTVEPGTILLLAQSDWLSQVPAEALAVAATADSAALASGYLGQLAGSAELSALLVGFDTGAAPAVRADAPLPLSSVRPPEIRPPVPEIGAKGTAGETARDAVKGIATGAGRLMEGVRALGERAHPGQAEPPAVTKSSREAAALPAAAWPSERRVAVEEVAATPGRSRWWLLLALIGIPLVIAAIVLAMLWMRTKAAEAQFVDLLNGATAAVNEAQTLPDEAMARLRLNTAREFLDKASALRPNDARLVKLQATYRENLDRINHVTPLYGIVPLWSFQDSGRRLERVIAGGDSLFVLDRGKQEIYRFVLSQLRDSVTPADKPALYKGQIIGEAAVSDLLDITWAEAVGSQRSRLLALDASGGLTSYDVTWATNRVPITGRDQWGLPQLMMAYGGNLYLADTKLNQVWRYRPGEKGYENAPEKYFSANTKVDLAGMQSMTIDGNIWLLFADGRLLKFFRGEPQPFEFKGLPDPLNAPTAVATSVDSDYLYVADAGNGRIVEFTKEGKFVRQFRPSQGDALRGVRSLYLDQASSVFYILTADKLYKADLPKPAAAATAPPGQ